MRAGIMTAVCLLALAGCGGGDSAPAPPPAPPPAAPPPPPVIGTSGGTVTDASGTTIVFPAGALTGDTTIRVAINSTGAPPLPANFTGVGNVYVITPHGGDFQQSVQVSIPAPNVTLLPTQEFRLAKAQPDGPWELLDTVVADGKLKANVNSFSYFMGMVITYPLPIAQAVPFKFDTTLTCGGTPVCTGLVGPQDIAFTVTGNGGQLPANCENPSAQIIEHLQGREVPGPVFPLTGFVRRTTALPDQYFNYNVRAVLSCNGNYANDWRASAYWDRGPRYPVLRVMSMPAQLDVVEGLTANVDAVLGGGAVKTGGPGDSIQRTPTADDRATIDWQRSDDGGASWRLIARSFQHEANPLPFGGGMPWQPWSVRHGFTATATDQGALIRVSACYVPLDVAAPPCVTSSATRINVLQQSSAPAIVVAPRPVLIRSAETADFSVTATGQPAPTLQWQTRPANSTGAWTNVEAGTGATTANYTTASRALSDNGTQYRVLATNAVGTAASTPVTVSVSDFDVAPSITTQPGSLSVTVGNDAVFAIDAYGTEAMSYQWRFNGANIAGANSPVLRMTGVTSANAGSYSVAVSNSAGAASSTAATLVVTDGVPVAVAPTIVTQPGPVSVNAGNTATFAVGVDGSGPFSFQWRRDGVNIAGATAAVYSLSPAQLPHAGMYSVVVSNSAGAMVSGNAMLDVTAAVTGVAPSITTQPATLILPLDGSSIMAVGATGSGPLSYQWYQDGVEIPFATQPVLNFFEIAASFAGSYTVTVTNSAGSRTSAPAQLIVLGAPVITQEPVATLGVEGNTATFSVTANGSALRYQWLLNGAPISGATGATYTTPTLVGANSGAVYSAIVFNSAGLVFSQGAVLTVQVVVAPSVTEQPANSSIPPGASAQLCVAFGGTLPMSFQMQRWNGAWTPLYTVTLNTNATVCQPTGALTLADSGAQFRFRASNAAGEALSNAATVTVDPPALSATTMVSVNMAGGTPGYMSREPSVSADGRRVAFISDGIDLVPGTTVNGHAYVRDLSTGVTTLIDHTPGGAEANRGVLNLKMSSDGRHAIFSSLADDITPNNGFATLDVYHADLVTGTIVQVNLLPDGTPAPSYSGTADLLLGISNDGRIVLFRSPVDVTVQTADPNPNYYLYARDMQSGHSRLVAGSPFGNVGYAALSDDGRYVGYVIPVLAPNPQAIGLYDLEAGADASFYSFDQSVAPAGIWSGMAISATGRYLSFAMKSPTLFGGSTAAQVVLIDRDNPTALETISTNESGVGNANSYQPQMSGDGRYVLFNTQASSLSPAAGMASSAALMRRDRVAQSTTTASLSLTGVPVQIGQGGEYHIARDGAVIAFVAEEQRMSGVYGGFQVYAAPRP